jgi:N-acyl-D-aspartate/D-glutamate deacylase
MADLVIRNGNLVDGSGAPARHADVVVDDGRVVDVVPAGTAPTAGARQAVDADGRLVTPGFVDVHTTTTPRPPGTRGSPPARGTG